MQLSHNTTYMLSSIYSTDIVSYLYNNNSYTTNNMCLYLYKLYQGSVSYLSNTWRYSPLSEVFQIIHIQPFFPSRTFRGSNAHIHTYTRARAHTYTDY